MTYYVYELVTEDGKIFYVGKGKGKRLLHHRRILSNPKRKEYTEPKYVRMLELINGRQFFERKVAESSDEVEMLVEERRRIRHYGLLALANMHSDALVGRTLKPEVGRRISKAKRGVPLSPGHRLALRVKHVVTPEGRALREEKIRKWTTDAVLKFVREKGFKTRQEWIKSSHRSYRAAWELGIMDQATKLMAPKWSVARRGHKLGAEHKAKILAGTTAWLNRSTTLRLLERSSYRFADAVLNGYRNGRVRCECALCGTEFYVSPFKARTRKACSYACGVKTRAKTLSQTLRAKRS